VALSLANALFNDSDVIVDLACGMGHVTRGIQHARPGCKVVGIDNDFFLLYIARHAIAKQAKFICAEADTDLPFKTDSIDSVLCVNAFHFFSNMKRCSEELDRIVNDEGVVILASLRHADCAAPTRNQAISAKNYRDLFQFAGVGVYSDNDVFLRYLRKQGPDLDRKLCMSEARQQALISLVATRNVQQLHVFHEFDQYPHGLGNLQINPLYKVVDSASGSRTIQLELSYPSQQYRQSQPELEGYLPAEVSIPREVLIDHSKDRHLIAELVSKCVLIDLPSNYSRKNGWDLLPSWSATETELITEKGNVTRHGVEIP
jgi:ubiquinone/menaquinone biosynthesis C-methylase UbiE